MKFKDVFKNSIGYIAVTLLCLLYLCVSFITVSKTGKTIPSILADTLVAFFFGLSITSVFEVQGLLDGDKDPRMEATASLHAEVMDRVSPYIEELSPWCERKTAEALKIQRIRIISVHGLKYSECFDEDGVVLPYVPSTQTLREGLSPWQRHKERKRMERAEKRRYQAYEKAVNLTITPLTAAALTSEGGRANDPYFLGRTKLDFEKAQTFKNVVSRIAIAILFGYYGASLIENFMWSTLIWTVLQIGLFIGSGVLSYYAASMFVTDEYRGRVIKKIDNLQAFENFIKTKGGKEDVEN